jgi:pimeloyl-ACP methyl ester carboxylesterase
VNTRVVSTGVADLEIAEAGPGGRPLLLVHGFGGSKEDFTDYLPRLGALGWHAVAPDLRGHGGSDRPADETGYSLAIAAEDLIGLLDALGWDQAVVLGHSMGGMVVQVLVVDHPERVAALVLMDTSHGMPAGIDEGTVAAGQAVVRDGGTALLVEIGKKSTEPGPLDTRPYLELCAKDPAYKAWSDYKTLSFEDAAWIGYAGDMVAYPDRLEGLRSLTMPTLVIVGAEDTPFLRQSEEIADAIPNARLARIGGGGHSPQFESPDAWWTAFRGFLDEL